MRHGFTLIEVVLSISVVAIGIIAVAMYLPIAIRAQEKARFEVFAAAKAIEIMEVMANLPQAHHPNYFDPEAAQPWDAPASYRAFHPDLEIKAASVRTGIAPVPRDIAYRLDSDNDEIRRLLDAGGELYYANPLAANGIKADSAMAIKPPSEARKLVFAVLGEAQSNAIGYLPWKAMPYRVQVPSPPAYKIRYWNYFDPVIMDIESRGDPDMGRVFWANLDPGGAAGCNGGMVPHAFYGEGYTGGGASGADGQGRASKAYVVCAWWYACQTGIPGPVLDGSADSSAIAAWIAAADWRQIRAISFLAHAAATLTKPYQLEPEGPLPGNVMHFGSACISKRNSHPGLRAGIPIPGETFVMAGDDEMSILGKSIVDCVSFFGPTVTPLAPTGDVAMTVNGKLMLKVSHATIARWHETALRAAVMWCAEHPYDWRVPRPANQMLMSDHPLVEWDLVDTATSALLAGDISGVSPAVAARQWRPVATMRDVEAGRNGLHQVVNWPAIRGDPLHGTLCRPFAAAERCRQIAFWSVDWQGYRDFETAPSAPVDASRYPKASPDASYGGNMAQNMDAANANDWDIWSMTSFDHWQPEYRNPEKSMLFALDPGTMSTGEYVRFMTLAHDKDFNAQVDNTTWQWHNDVTRLDAGWSPRDVGGPVQSHRVDPRLVFSGRFGADRNFNQYLDRGPIPPSIRMRATTLGRYVVYDPRLVMSFR